MKPHFNNQAISSFILWMDHQILQAGSGFYNTNSKFYSTNSIYNGLYTYSCPFSQLVYDSSVSGASVPTGIYVNNILCGPASSGFAGFDYNRGRAHFSGVLPASAQVSGNFSIKEFSVVLTNEPEEKILFENQLTIRPKIPFTPTGLNNDELTYPCIFVKPQFNQNTPFALGGMVTSEIRLTAYVFAENQFQLDSLIGVLTDTKYKNIALLDLTDMPFDSYGRLKGNLQWNYQSIAASKSVGVNSLYIADVKNSLLSQKLLYNTQKINPEAKITVIDFNIQKQRYIQ